MAATDSIVVTHHDFNLFPYSSFFVTGLVEAARRDPALAYRVKRSRPRHGQVASRAHWMQLTVERNGVSKRVVVDPTDRNQADSATGEGYQLDLLEASDLYFKVNYSESGIDAHPATRQNAYKIRPAGPVYPVRPAVPFVSRPRLRPLPSTDWTLAETSRRLVHLRRTPSERYLRKMRSAPRTHDLHFVMTYYGEGILSELDDFRVELAERLRKLDITGVVALAGDLPKSLEHLRAPLVPLKDYLRAVSGARTAIYLRGVHDCLSFKLGSLLANGVPLVGQPLHNELGVDMAPEFSE